ncbi:hypothetical protein N665_1425s0006 [Sinapis alba]|nr:hypothetical protein N665_1425s0006 [Sinapis alba]
MSDNGVGKTKEKIEAKKLKAYSSHYFIIKEKLYKRRLNESCLLCVSRKDHDGSCGSHFSRRSLTIIIKKYEYFWPTIAHDSEQFAVRCDKCQQHASMIYQPAQKLSSVSSPYPFMRWSWI